MQLFCDITVYKYKKETDQTLGDKLAKLNLHSLKKKGSRFKGRLSTTIGLAPQVEYYDFFKFLNIWSVKIIHL